MRHSVFCTVYKMGKVVSIRICSLESQYQLQLRSRTRPNYDLRKLNAAPAALPLAVPYTNALVERSSRRSRGLLFGPIVVDPKLLTRAEVWHEPVPCLLGEVEIRSSEFKLFEAHTLPDLKTFAKRTVDRIHHSCMTWH